MPEHCIARGGAGRPRVRRYRWLAALAVIAVALAGVVAWRAHWIGRREVVLGAVATTATASTAAVLHETRPTLDPARFVGKAARAHQVAREMPDVLDQLYCYCGCDKTNGHKTLLSCFTDGHAAT